MKTVEEIRNLFSGKTQPQFAEEVGLSLRAYCQRIKGEQPDWRISELISASKYTNGEVAVVLDGVKYDITIKEG